MSYKIEISGMKELFNQFLNPVSPEFSFGHTKLTFPLDELSCHSKSNGYHYAIKTKLHYFNQNVSSKIKLPVGYLGQRFSIKVLSEDLIFVLDKNSRHEYEIQPAMHGYSHDLEINCGSTTTTQKKLLNLDNFIDDLENYGYLVQETVKGLYYGNGHVPPNITSFWRADVGYGSFGADSRENNSSKISESEDNELSDVHVEKTNISFNDIGGLILAKEKMKNLCIALKNPGLYEKWGTKPPKGALLYGLPGTGKTLLVKAIVNETDADIYNIRISDMTSKWYGQSEKKVQNIFDKAKKNKKKTILYFDEFDALGANKDDSHEATVRIVSTILTNLDGLNPQDNTLVIASTNRLDAIDPALVRPGRIDLLIEVPLPDKQAREEIFKINFRLAEGIAKRILFSEPNYDKLGEKTEGYSGADISEIVRRTLEEKVKEEYNKKECKIVTSEEIYAVLSLYERNKKLNKKIGFVNS